MNKRLCCSIILITICLVAGTVIAQDNISNRENCKIKGIISSKGIKMYLLPGHRLYNKITIRESEGEQWFCSEGEAEQAGFMSLPGNPRVSRKLTPKPALPQPQPTENLEVQELPTPSQEEKNLVEDASPQPQPTENLEVQELPTPSQEKNLVEDSSPQETVQSSSSTETAEVSLEEFSQVFQEAAQSEDLTSEQKKMLENMAKMAESPSASNIFSVYLQAMWIAFKQNPTMLIVSLGGFIFTIVVWWLLFTKADRPGWGALIPIYSLYLKIKVAGMSGVWVLIFFGGVFIGALFTFLQMFSLATIMSILWAVLVLIMCVLMCLGIAKNFGKSPLFGIGLLLGNLFYPIHLALLAMLAFSDATYNAEA